MLCLTSNPMHLILFLKLSQLWPLGVGQLVLCPFHMPPSVGVWVGIFILMPGWEDHSLEGRRDFLPDLVVLSPSWSLSFFNRVPNPSLQHLSACCTSANFNFKFMGSPWYRQP